MTTEILRAAVQRRIAEVREESIRRLRLCKFIPATVTDKGIVAASSIDEIALRANECNAWIECLDGVKAIIDQEVKKILSPEKGPDESVSKQKREAIY